MKADPKRVAPEEAGAPAPTASPSENSAKRAKPAGLKERMEAAILNALPTAPPEHAVWVLLNLGDLPSTLLPALACLERAPPDGLSVDAACALETCAVEAADASTLAAVASAAARVRAADALKARLPSALLRAAVAHADAASSALAATARLLSGAPGLCDLNGPAAWEALVALTYDHGFELATARDACECARLAAQDGRSKELLEAGATAALAGVLRAHNCCRCARASPQEECEPFKAAASALTQLLARGGKEATAAATAARVAGALGSYKGGLTGAALLKQLSESS
jgi:hypothetical protein